MAIRLFLVRYEVFKPQRNCGEEERALQFGEQRCFLQPFKGAIVGETYVLGKAFVRRGLIQNDAVLGW